MNSLIINNIDFNQKLYDLKSSLHEDIDYRYKGYFLMPCLDFGYGAPEMLLKFWASQRDIDPDIHRLVQEHFWELI